MDFVERDERGTDTCQNIDDEKKPVIRNKLAADAMYNVSRDLRVTPVKANKKMYDLKDFRFFEIYCFIFASSFLHFCCVFS